MFFRGGCHEKNKTIVLKYMIRGWEYVIFSIGKLTGRCLSIYVLNINIDFLFIMGNPLSEFVFKGARN